MLISEVSDMNCDYEYYEPMIELKPYKPVVVKHDGSEEEEGISVRVVDGNETYPDVWVDVTIDTYGDLEFDWNMWIFHKDNEYEQKVRAFMNLAVMFDGWLWCLLTESVSEYLSGNNLIGWYNDKWQFHYQNF